MIRPQIHVLLGCLLAAGAADDASARSWRRHPMWSATAVAHANSVATLRPTAPRFVNANQVYPFADGAIFQIFTAPERVTDIALQSGETLGAVASGDTARWVIGDTTSGNGAAKQTHVLVKPFGPDLQTNLVITTDRRTYHISLVSTRGIAMSAISWSYPADALLALRAADSAKETAQPIASGVELRLHHHGCGCSLAPAARLR